MQMSRPLHSGLIVEQLLTGRGLAQADFGWLGCGSLEGGWLLLSSVPILTETEGSAGRVAAVGIVDGGFAAAGVAEAGAALSFFSGALETVTDSLGGGGGGCCFLGL